MTSVWESLTVDARDPARLARWWAEALGYQVISDKPDEVEIRRAPDRLPGIVFVPGRRATRQAKNRLHLDLRPADQEAEVERLVDMGARHVDVGQGDVEWTVLADPEGNEFCVLRQREQRRVTRSSADSDAARWVAEPPKDTGHGAVAVRAGPGPGAALGGVPPAGRQDPGAHRRHRRLPAYPADPLAGGGPDRPGDGRPARLRPGRGRHRRAGARPRAPAVRAQRRGRARRGSPRPAAASRATRRRCGC